MSDEDRKTFGFLVDVTLTEEEIKAQLERNADIDRKMIAIKGEKALANSGFNEDLKTLRKEQETLLSTINTGKAKLEVQCYHDKDERRNIMYTRRASDGFIVDERALTAEELHQDRQGSLFDKDAAGAPAPAIEGAEGDQSEEAPDPDAASAVADYAAIQEHAKQRAAEDGAVNESEPAADDEDDPDPEDDSTEAMAH